MAERVRRKKGLLLVALKAGASRPDFEQALREFKAAGGAPKGIDQRWVVRLGDDAIPRIAHQDLMSASPEPFDAVLQLSTEDEGNAADFADIIAAAAERLDPWLDRSRSAVLIGDEYRITAGDGPIMIVMPLRRLPELTHEGFMEHWFSRHADLGASVDGVRYRQNHFDYPATEALSKRLGFTTPPLDGVTESYFLDTDEAYRLMSGPAVAVDAIIDEKRFIDHSRSQFAFYTAI